MTAERASVPNSKRGLKRAEAAAYVGLAVTKFRARVRMGELPRPLPFGRPEVWDRVALDLAMDRLSGLRRETPPEADEATALGALHARQNALRHRKTKQAQP